MENGAILAQAPVALRPWRLTSCVIFDFTDLIDKCPQGGAPLTPPYDNSFTLSQSSAPNDTASAFRPRRYRAMRR